MDVYYVQINILCILVLLIAYLAVKNRRGILTARHIAFYELILVTVIMCVSDIVAWVTVGKMFSGARSLIHISNIIYDASITWIGYAWLKYARLRTSSLEHITDSKWNLLTAIPLMVMMVLLLLNPLTGWMFTVDGNNQYERGSLLFLHWIISWGYLLAATFVVMRKMHSVSSKVEKRQLRPLLYFIIPPALGAIVQMFVYGITSTQCGIALAILIITVSYLSEEVSKDTLTGLNNRRAFENFVIEQLQRSPSRITVMMCDVDQFKSVNDTFGHTVGDLVLRRVADIMKEACAGNTGSLFLCRYGGDEFIICGLDLSEADIEKLKESISEKLLTASTTFANKFHLGISIGQASQLCTTYEDVEAVVSLADAAMYEAKESKKKA